MKVVVDRATCQGTGLCVAVAGDVFEIDEDGAVVALVETVREGHLRGVHQAVQVCPVGALSIRED